ncbi:NfeD family protein [Ornithinimicrobium sp. Y1847]|uniref:NfeD family protein n=1 Tax=unclassified Ornithinimicrobium TaxID=2615080 RepID=UPI003B6846CD
MDSMVYIIVGGIGAFLLLASMIFDGLEEVTGLVDTAAEGVLSLVAVGSAATIFGAVGFIASGLGATPLLTVVLAVVLAVLVWYAVARAIRAAKRSSRRGVTRSYLVGDTGVTTHETDGTHGEVRLDAPDGGVRLARSAGPRISADTKVRIVAMDGAKVVVLPADGDPFDPPTPPALPGSGH